MLDIRLIERGLEKPGKTKGGLATAMGVRPGAVSEILSGIRLIKASEIASIIAYLELNSVPIMGRVGAGASIEPEHEQVPPEGLGDDRTTLPDRRRDHRVRGRRRFHAAEIREWRYYRGLSRTAPSVVELLRRGSCCAPENRRAVSEDDRARKSPTVVNLTSFNAKPITGVKLEWIGEICVTLPRGQIERLRNKAAARARKATRTTGGRTPDK